MSEIKALEELRESFDDCTTEAGIEPNTFDTVWITKSCAIAMLDEIQAEVDERFMELPLDADGVPIRVGDVLDPPSDCDDYVTCQVVKLTYDLFEKEWYFEGEAVGSFMGFCGYFDTAGWTHHKPRTLEDVLCDFANDVAMQGHQIGLTGRELSEKYAAEIRELLGVDA